MNWGYRIAILYTAFAGFILTLVISSFQYEVNLVAKDYYKQEITYQKEIDKMNNVQRMKKNLQIAPEADMLLITFPEAVQQGELHFFRPSDEKKDFKLSVGLDDQNRQHVPVSALERGLWRLKVNWTSKGKYFYMEEQLIKKEDGSLVLASQDKTLKVGDNGLIRSVKK